MYGTYRVLNTTVHREACMAVRMGGSEIGFRDRVVLEDEYLEV